MTFDGLHPDARYPHLSIRERYWIHDRPARHHLLLPPARRGRLPPPPRTPHPAERVTRATQVTGETSLQHHQSQRHHGPPILLTRTRSGVHRRTQDGASAAYSAAVQVGGSSLPASSSASASAFVACTTPSAWFGGP